MQDHGDWRARAGRGAEATFEASFGSGENDVGHGTCVVLAARSGAICWNTHNPDWLRANGGLYRSQHDFRNHLSDPPRVATPDRLYLDHAATTPLLPAAKAAMMAGMENWANPSSPHSDGRAARAAVEDARARISAALGWNGHLIFTSGASEAIALALGRAKVGQITTSSVEHDAVLRVTPGAVRLEVDVGGVLKPVQTALAKTLSSRTDERTLIAVQHVNNETGVIQPLDHVQSDGTILFADCAQSAAKLPLPDAAMIAISAHKFGGPPGIGALLIRDLALIEPTGGQEQGYRAGTENLPAILGMAAALEARTDWLPTAQNLRDRLDAAVESGGGQVVARDSLRLPAIASYRMPRVSARAQLIQFDLAGISVSAGSACSSGSLKISHVLGAMGWDDAAAGEVVRVSFGPSTSEANVDRFIAAWRAMAARAPR
jgi:cysteine desulfurase